MLGIPTGPVSGCAACALARPVPSINIDFNFGLSHLAACGTSRVELDPPNKQLYPDMAAILPMLAANSSSTDLAGAHAQIDACNDFNAARLLGRTSEKVRPP